MKFSVGYPSTSVTIHHDNCPMVQRAMRDHVNVPNSVMKPCLCGTPNQAHPQRPNQMWFCDAHLDMSAVKKFFNGRLWQYRGCTHCKTAY